MISVGGVWCCIGAAVLYFTGKSFEGRAVELESVTRVSKLKDLAKLWDAASTVLPLVVAVSGWVRSDTPIKCEYNDGKGVIMELTEECHYLKQGNDKEKEGHNDKREEWKEAKKLVSSKCNEVPWYLEDNTGRARVLGARGASGFELKYGGEIFEKSTQTAEQEKLDLEKGLKMLGVKKIEHFLPIGRFLTVIGEVTKDGKGTFSIQKPNRGPFYVSCKTIAELIDFLRSISSFLMYASVVVGVVGVGLVLFHESPDDIGRPPERKDERKPRPPPPAAAANQASKSEDERRRDSEEADQCRLCFESKYNSVFTPCGHMYCCMVCALRLTRCPVCRRHVERVVRTFSP